MRPGLLTPGGKRGAELGGMDTTSVLAGTAELAPLTLGSELVTLSSTSNDRPSSQYIS